ncbi:alpha-L-rhamnosidase C-terminal domain-containing protein [Pelagicoccus mobilis]|uniref:Alpha-L-rhamnosidase n=1 Tax=Pelagicoccus mobilis TaxID=415221 RepID=A0A934VMY8_9BACT|nr:alpha-L-rhamnosidase C-terminal domain-containing protein [Pelagicoccus mobilis]MBK1879351.1 hypothetical protein [Pelagicoccus mobilis]
MKICLSTLLSLFFITAISAKMHTPLQLSPKNMEGRFWKASWVAPKGTEPNDYGVYLFRKPFVLGSTPSEFIIHISADNRYRLFVNGSPVLIGPARGDLGNWRYESVDIAPFLNSGSNVLAVQVWNFGIHRPQAQFSRRTGLLIEGNSALESVVNTNTSWIGIENQAYSPIPIDKKQIQAYMVTDPGVEIDGKLVPWGWEKESFSDGDWEPVEVVGRVSSREQGTAVTWSMVPRMIPLMESKRQTFAAVRKANGCRVDDAFLAGQETVKIGPNTRCSFLLDQGVLTKAFPELVLAGGAGSQISLGYAESLFLREVGLEKGDRNEVEGKVFRGFFDRFLPDGGDDQFYRPLRFRTFRYVLVEIETASDPLELKRLDSVFSAYPLEERAEFETNDPELSKIWEVGWRTQRLCAHEVFYDCPYYEQLMYVGDTRIQALVTKFVSGDDTLMRKAIELFDNSRTSIGLTLSRYPSKDPQYIPPYSLVWINMLHDYFMLNPDADFVRSKLKGVRSVLEWFEENQHAESGLYIADSWWNFVDWTREWRHDGKGRKPGMPPVDQDGISSILNLQWALALRDAENLYRHFGWNIEAEGCREKREAILATLYRSCWNSERYLLADTPEQEDYSQHTSLLLVLADTENALGLNHKKIMEKVISDVSLSQCTMYFRFYLHEALKQSGLGAQYLGLLDQWRAMLDSGLTTFAEKPDPTRSDCHAWSSSPNYHFLTLVCGVESVGPGFSKIKIKPSLGALERAKFKIPHANGYIEGQFKQDTEGVVSGWVTLPNNVEGVLVLNDTELKLESNRRIDF